VNSKNSFVRSVLVTNVILVIMVAPVAWWIGGIPVLLGALLGGMVGMMNLYAMSWLLRRIIGSDTATESKTRYAVMLAGKFLAVLAVILIAVVVIGLDALGFLLGLSTTVVSLFVGGFAYPTGVEVSENKESEQT
jgi:hypothetical protein